MKHIILTILIAATSLAAKSQNLIALLGKSLNSSEVQQFLDKQAGEEIESFVPFRRAYKLSFKESGLELEFNSNMSLYRINVYDSGYSFNAYTGDLPFDAYWGSDSVSIQDAHGVMEPEAQNPFIKSYRTEDHSTEFYFRNGRLEHLKLTASEKMILDQAAGSLQSWGMRLFPDGIAVKGDVLDGEGIMVWGENAASYEGEWSYGLPHGVGVYIDSFGNKYAGEFKLGFFWGSGSYVSPYYDYSYDGYFLMGKRHGQGVIKYSNGTGYNGDWFQDVMQGRGQYNLGTDYYYQGQMKGNSFNGRGTLTTPDGYIKGKFKNGKPHGFCEQYSSQSQQTLSGTWQNGKKEGEFILNSFGFDRTVLFKNDVEVTPGAEN